MFSGQNSQTFNTKKKDYAGYLFLSTWKNPITRQTLNFRGSLVLFKIKTFHWNFHGIDTQGNF